MKKAAAIILTTFILSGCNIQQRMQGAFHSEPAPIENKGDLFYGKQSVSRIIQVVEGDTLMSIAEAHGIPFNDLVKINELSSPYTLKIGQKLKIPTEHYHTVAEGDTMTSISQSYNVNRGYLAAINHKQPPYNLNVGERIRIPHKESVFLVAELKDSRALRPVGNGTKTADKKDSAAAPNKFVESITQPRKVLAEAITNSIARKPKKVQKSIFKLPNPLGKKNLEWPLSSGKILARFSGKNEGINISAVNNSPVMASGDGEVIYAGSDLKSYGKLVIIKHENNIMTAYAHNSKLLVSKGQKVSCGQIISRIGSTGEVDSPQLYFSVRKGAKTIDPEKRL
jgi:murein DD-endopeptidase MepM/ murein hydrolase activator NlpD